jgi:hypothetical protein
MMALKTNMRNIMCDAQGLPSQTFVLLLQKQPMKTIYSINTVL